LAFGCLADGVRVGNVLRPTGSQLGRDEVVSGYKVRFQAGGCIDYAFNAPFPCLVKIDSRNIGYSSAFISSKLGVLADDRRFIRASFVT
jgi:hypothetical protein